MSIIKANCRYWPAIAAILYLPFFSCVSTKKFKAAQIKIDSLSSDNAMTKASLKFALDSKQNLALESQRTNMQIATLNKQIDFLKLQVPRTFEKLEDYGILAPGTGKKILTQLNEVEQSDPYIQNLQGELAKSLKEKTPGISNPPPRQSAEKEIERSVFSKYKNYGELDAWLEPIFERAKEKHFFFRFDGGFAIGTESQDFSAAWHKLQEQPSEGGDGTASLLGSIRTWYKNLTHAEPVYTRFFLLIVSDQFESFGEKPIGPTDFTTWYKTDRFTFPSGLASTPTSADTRIVLLSYEYKQDANTSVKKSYYGGTQCQRRLEGSDLYKYLKK